MLASQEAGMQNQDSAGSNCALRLLRFQASQLPSFQASRLPGLQAFRPPASRLPGLQAR